MIFKIFASLVAAGLMILFTGAVAVKLKEIALAVVILIGVGMMLWDLWESVRHEEE